DEIFKTIVSLKAEKEGLIAKEIELEDAQVQQQKLIEVRDQQNNRLEELKKQKDELLTFTKGEERKFQQVLEENKNILPSLRAQLYDLQILGDKIKFDDAFSSAKYIGSSIGVRPEYLLGILKVESDLGKNTGSGNWNDDMYRCYLKLSKIYSTRKEHFIKRANDEKNAYMTIVTGLNIDPDSVKVSREPTYGCGGAMGPAQFIPTTWLSYDKKISEITGHYPSNPWDLTDAMTAMALYVSTTPGVVEGNYDAEYKAACKYLTGKTECSGKLKFYPNDVMYWAGWYEKLINS
ncbi:MAG: lytic murein transglycosylase, partial [Minisyncoccia bacterium]